MCCSVYSSSKTEEASPQGPEDTVYDCAHGNVPAEHVKCDQDGTPSELSREVGSYNAEQHHNNIQHDALHATSQPASVTTCRLRSVTVADL